MSKIVFKNQTYSVDEEGFLLDSRHWDENFAEGTAPSVKIPSGLTDSHWKVINSIRQFFKDEGYCPMVHQTCKMNQFHLKDLELLFPAGHLRGACKLAGITYREGYASFSFKQASDSRLPLPVKTYGVDVRGFLIDPEQWDEQFAVFKAHEMKMHKPLKDEHWRVISFLRDRYKTHRIVPTVFETCRANDMEIEDLEALFPDGYHRGAVKIAGLRVR